MPEDEKEPDCEYEYEYSTEYRIEFVPPLVLDTEETPDESDGWATEYSSLPPYDDENAVSPSTELPPVLASGMVYSAGKPANDTSDTTDRPDARSTDEASSELM